MILRLLILAITAALASCNTKNSEITPIRKTIVEAVYAGGTIHPSQEYKAFSIVSGNLQQLYVSEGDTVKTGDMLFSIDSRDPLVREQNARDALAFAGGNAAAHSPLLDELLENITSIEAKKTNDSASFARVKNLYENNAASKSEFDRALLQLAQSQAQLAAAWSKYKSSKSTLENQLSAARHQMELATVTKDNYIVRSLINGKVFGLYKESGELVNSQQPVAILGNDESFNLQLVVDQTDITRIAIGQKVLYSIDAVPDSIFTAKIIKIYPMLDVQTQSYRVDAKCDAKPMIPFLGTQVQANIIVKQKENAFVIPRGYVRPDGKVLVKESEKIREVKPVFGIRNLEFIEVISGLSESSTIVSGY